MPELASGAAMRRREFIQIIAGSAVTASPLAARAQQPAVPVVGFLNSSSREGYAKFLAEFRRGLNSMGFVEGQTVVVEYRWAEGHYDRLPDLVADLIRRQVAVIAATSTPAALAARKATTTIPVVFTSGSDPVELGLVTNIARPGGNVTGATQITMEVGPKRVELLHQLIPNATVLAIAVNPDNPAVAAVQIQHAQDATRALGLKLEVVRARNEEEFDKAVAGLPQRAGGLVIGAGDTFFLSESAKLAEIAVRHKVPAIFHGREFAAAGGLLSYGASVAESYLLAGVYTGRILRGEKPGDLPVQRSSKLEIFINMKTAKTLSVTIPQGLMIAADEVFE
jgi:putative ABC transport system substrate-binding protein